MNIPRFVKIQWERVRRQYYRFRYLWPIWFYVLNRKSRKAWKWYLMHNRMDGAVKEIADALKKDGIALVPLARLFPDGTFFEELRQFAMARLNEPENQKAIRDYTDILLKRYTSGEKAGKLFKDFRVNLWYVANNERKLDLENPFSRLALSKPILEIINSYMEFTAKFAYAGLQTTIVVPPGTPEYLSQRWHRDPEDKKFIRMFLYLNDVTEQGTGPFMYIKGSQYGGRWRNIFPQIPPVGNYPPNGEVEHIVLKEDILTCLAKEGTLIFADTSGLHRGGYSTKNRRILFTSTFFSKAATQPRSFSPPAREARAALPQIARYAVM